MVPRALSVSLTLSLASLLSACSSIRGTGLALWPANWGNEEGYIWCNARYLDIYAYPDPIAVDPPRDTRLRLAARGYPYAVAASLTLQKPGKSEDKHFASPTFLEQDPSLNVDDPSSGFQAATFRLRPPDQRLGAQEIVVAFRGSDTWRDYWKHNLAVFWSPAQFRPARDYVQRVSEKYPGQRLVVAGFSLGGGLAVHVTQHPDTSQLISEAWALNPSPRTGVPEKVDRRIYTVAVSGEILAAVRRNGLGAPEQQYSNDFGLLRSSSVYGHSRWVLTRQMLGYADLVAYERSGRQADLVTPPLTILRASAEPVGCKGERRSDLVRRGRLTEASRPVR
jgi:hypothetical protein